MDQFLARVNFVGAKIIYFFSQKLIPSISLLW